MKNLLIVFLPFTVLFHSCKMSDIRTDYMLKNEQDEAKVAELIQKVEASYGGYENWINLDAVSAKGTDHWPTFHWRIIASPWKDKITAFNYTWGPNTDNSKIQLLQGKRKGLQYGIQNWATYEISNESISFNKNKKMWFHLPTMEYFFEFPFRIREAELIQYAGKKIVQGLEYELLFFTWKSVEPNRQMDQYLVYLNPKNFRIDFLELTVRDQAKWAYATVTFQDFMEVDQFLFPRDLRFYFQNKLPGKTLGHKITIEDFQVFKEFDEKQLIPAPEIVKTKF